MTLLLDIQRLTIELPAGADRVYAVQDLSLRVDAGRTLCVVGESASFAGSANFWWQHIA